MREISKWLGSMVAQRRFLYLLLLHVVGPFTHGLIMHLLVLSYNGVSLSCFICKLIQNHTYFYLL